ncbi:hypothetical protein, partial [Rhodopseudomonas sp. BR0M22]|uniref:hypothetical protein n=1 Tax=Rhodopseudomonas sp. BR0M22 TaxID=2269369 RepID=UPI0019677674
FQAPVTEPSQTNIHLLLLVRDRYRVRESCRPQQTKQMCECRRARPGDPSSSIDVVEHALTRGMDARAFAAPKGLAPQADQARA